MKTLGTIEEMKNFEITKTFQPQVVKFQHFIPFPYILRSTTILYLIFLLKVKKLKNLYS